MALITGSKVTVTPTSGQGASGWLTVFEDSRTTSDSNVTISGHINLYMSKVTSSGSATASNTNSTITTTKGTVTKSLSNKSVTCGSSSKSGNVQIGTFTITIPRGTTAQTVTISVSSSVTVNYTSYSKSTTGTSSGSTTVSVPVLQSYAVTYNNNNGTGTTQSQTKYYNVALSLNYTNPSLSGYNFLGWATSEADASAGTYSGTYVRGYSYTSNAALTLYGTYELSYSKPTINNLTVERCSPDPDNPGQYKLDDEGEYALVSFDWSVFVSNNTQYYGGNTTPYSSNTIDTCTITVGTETATPILSGSSGSESVTVGSGNFSVDTEYSASVAITDTQTIVSPHTTTVNGALPTSSFPMDVNANGTAVALLRPAPDNDTGVFIGDDLDVDGDLTVVDINAGGDITATGDVTDGAGTSIADLLEVQNTYGVLTDLTGNTTLTTSAKKLPLKTFSGNGCSLSSNGIKVKNAGTYLVSGTAYFHSGFTVNDIIHLQLYKNSTLLEDFGVRMTTVSPYENVTLSPYIVTLAANDVMYLYAYNQTAARGQVNTGATRNFLMLNRIA